MGCKHEIECGTRTIIGIRDFTACVKPESNLWINDVPGITLKKAAGIADEEVQTGTRLLENVIKRGIMLTFQDFSAKIGGHFNFNAVVETRMLNYFDATFLPAAAAKEKGLVIRRWRSELAQTFIEELYIKSKNSGIATVKIYDGAITKSYEVNLIADKVYVLRTDYVAVSERIEVKIDNTLFGVYSGVIKNTSSGGCYDCGTPSSNNGLSITGWDGDKEVSKYYGIGVKASVRCYEENIICSLMPRMYFLFWYAAAREFFDEQLSSSRVNPITLFSKESAENNLKKYTAKYDEAFKDFVPTIKQYLLKTKGECISCNGSKYVQSTP